MEVRVLSGVPFFVLTIINLICTIYEVYMNKELLTSSQKGEIAKLKVELRATEKGWICSRTVADSRYDLILDDGFRLHRVQVKYADSNSSRSDNAIMVNLKKDDGKLNYRMYSKDEIDAIVIYIPRIEKFCWFNSSHFHKKTAITIRLGLPKNGQKKNLRFVDDFQW